MDGPSRTLFVRELDVRADHGQIYIYSPETMIAAFEDSDNVYHDALEDAVSSRRFVGVAGGLVDLLTPGQWNWHTPLRVEVWTAEPPDAAAEWDHEVELDLDVPDGRLIFEASGGTGLAETDVPPEDYRARVAGRGFTVLGRAGAEGNDSYRLQLWWRTRAAAPELRRSWPGWEGYA